MSYKTITDQLIAAAFETGAITIRPEQSVICTSPVDLNIQKFTADHGPTNLVIEALTEKLQQIGLQKDAIIVGITFEGIPTGKLLAHQTKRSFYALKRDADKIPGVVNLWHKDVVIVTGTVATGQTLAESAYVINQANGECNHAFTIFSKEFVGAKKLFTGEERITSGGRGSGSDHKEGRDYSLYEKQLPKSNRTLHALITPKDIANFIEQYKTQTSPEQRELLKNWVSKNQIEEESLV